MKIVIHDYLRHDQHPYEGDAVSLERVLREDFPWACIGYEGDLDTILWMIDHHPYMAVEVQDPSPHPFLKV